MTDHSLPPNWVEAPLGELFETQTGCTPPKNDERHYGCFIPFVKPPELQGKVIDSAEDGLSELGAGKARILPPGSVLVSCIGNLGKTAINRVPVAFNQQINAILPRDELADARFILYQTQSASFVRRLQAMSSATTISIVNKSKFNALTVRLAPRAAQTRIVSKIEELFSRIDEGERALERVQKLTERNRQSVLKAAVAGELTRQWRDRHQGQLESGDGLLKRILRARREEWERAAIGNMRTKGVRPTRDEWKNKYREPSLPSLTGLPKLPETWTWASLSMLCGEDSTNGISVKGSDAPPGVPALRLDAMATPGFDYSAKRYIPISPARAQRLYIREGDLFVSRANGSLSLVGRSVLAQNPPENVVFPDTMIRYRLIAQPDVRNWTHQAWGSPLVRGQIERRAKTTAGIYKISQEDIAQIAIPLPPLAEQEAALSTLGECLAQIDRLKSDKQHVSAQSLALRRAILNAAFSGRLVTQDSCDEPASSLLERHRANEARSHG